MIPASHAPAMPYYVYILAGRPGGALYVGGTNDPVRRVRQHRERLGGGFTKRHNIKRLMHFEIFPAIRDALQREKSIRRWPRK